MAIYSVSDLRTKMVDGGFSPSEASDEQLIYEYSSLVGKDPYEVANYLGVKTGQDSSLVGAAFGAGVDELQALGYNALAAGANLVNATGSEESLRRSAEAQQYEALMGGRPEYSRIEDQEGFGETAGYLAYQTVKSLPIMLGISAASVAGGGIGGTVAARGLTSAAMSRGGQALASRVAGSRLAARTVAQGSTIGSRVGGFGGGYSVGVGSLYDAAAQAAEESGQEIDIGDVFAKGIPYAALESIVPMTGSALVRGTAGGLVGKLATKGAGTRAAAGFVGAGITEAGTELGQTELEISMNPYLTEAEKESMRLNAAIAGGVSGGTFGGVAATFAKRQKSPDEILDLLMQQKAEQDAAAAEDQDRAVSTGIDVSGAAPVQTELDLGRPTVLTGENAVDEAGAPDTGFAEPTQATKVAPSTPEVSPNQLGLDFTGIEEAQTLATDLENYNQALEQDIRIANRTSKRDIVRTGRKLVDAENRLAAAEQEVVAANDAKKQATTGKQAAAAAQVVNQAIAVRDERMAERDALREQVDGYERIMQAKADRPVFTRALAQLDTTDAQTLEESFYNLDDNSQEVLRRASPAIAERFPAKTEVEVQAEEAVAEVATDQKKEVKQKRVQETVEQTQVDEDTNTAEEVVNQLNAEVKSERGKATGKVTLAPQKIGAVIRMLRDPSVEPSPYIAEKGTNRADKNASEEDIQHVQGMYDAAMEVVKAAKELYDYSQNTIRSVSTDEKNTDANLQADTLANRIRFERGARNRLKKATQKLVSIAGSERNAEAIVAALKTRNEKRTGKGTRDSSAYDEIAAEMNREGFKDQAEFEQAVDSLLSSSLAQHIQGALDVQDYVQGGDVRYNRKQEKDPTLVKKRRAVVAKDGFLGLVSTISGQGGTGLSYERVLASAINQAIRAMKDEQIEINVQFLEDTDAAFPNYDPATNTLTISEVASNEEVLHEALHAVLQWYVTTNPESEYVQNLSTALDELFTFMSSGEFADVKLPAWQKDEAARIVGILKNLRDEGRETDAVLELISYGTTMHAFKQLLKSVHAGKSKPAERYFNVLHNVWKRMIQLFRGVLGGKAEQDSLAAAVLENTVMLLDNAIQNVESTEFEQARRGDRLFMEYNPNSDAANTDAAGVQQGDKTWTKYSRLNGKASVVFKPLFDLVPYEAWNKKIKDNVLTPIAEKIREEYPNIQAWVSYFNATFSTNTVTEKNVRQLKRDIQIPQVLANMIAEQIKTADLQTVEAILQYLDGDMNALQRVPNAAQMQDRVAVLKEYIDQFISVLPEEDQAALTQGKFTDNLLFVTSVKDLAKRQFGQSNIRSLIRNRNEVFEPELIEQSDGLIREDANGNPILTDDFYVVDVAAYAGGSYQALVSVDIYEALNGNLPITDGAAKVRTELKYKHTTSVGNKYAFRASGQSYKDGLDKARAKQYAYALENTIHALGANYAARNFGENMYTQGIQEGLVFDREADLQAYYDEVINAERQDEGKRPVSFQVLEGDAINANSRKVRASHYWVKVPKTGYGPLSGTIIKGTEWAFMQDATDRSISFEEIANVMRIYKKTKTVYNPGTQITNVASNVALMMLHDISPAALKDAVRIMYLYKKAPGQLKPWEREMIAKFESTGALVGNFSAQEVTKGIYEALRDNTTREEDKSYFGTMVDMLKANAAMGKILTGLEKADQLAVDMYAAGDNMFRLALFMKTVSEQTERQGLQRPDDQIFNEAADAAKAGFMDYDIDELGIKTARAYALPFVSWFYRAVPLVGKLAVTKPWRLAKLLTMWAALDALLAGLAGDDEEQRKKGDPKLQDRLFGFGPHMHIRIPFFGEGNKAMYFRIGDYFPLSTSFKGLPNEGFMGLDWWPSAMTPGGPLITGVLAMAGGINPYTGDPLSSPTATNTERFLDRMTELYNQMGVPALRSSNLEFIYDKAVKGGKRDIVGDEASWTMFALAKVGGLKFVESNPAKEAAVRKFKESEVMRDFGAAINKAKRDAAKYGYFDYQALDAELSDLYRRRQEEIDEIYQIERD